MHFSINPFLLNAVKQLDYLFNWGLLQFGWFFLARLSCLIFRDNHGAFQFIHCIFAIQGWRCSSHKLIQAFTLTLFPQAITSPLHQYLWVFILFTMHDFLGATGRTPKRFCPGLFDDSALPPLHSPTHLEMHAAILLCKSLTILSLLNLCQPSW